MSTTLADPPTAGKNRASMNDDLDPPVLFPRHVARMWSRLAAELGGEPVSADTVKRYVRESYRRGGRYGNDPVPRPLYDGLRPYWRKDQEEALAAWWMRRRGRIGDPRSDDDRDAHGKRI